jgi:hypothetical protein
MAVAFVVGLGGCSVFSDTSLDIAEPVNGSADGGPGTDGGADVEVDAEPLPEGCAFLGLSPQQGQVCDEGAIDSCGIEGVCLELSPLLGGRCYTSCLPTVCGDTPCDVIGRCTPLEFYDASTGNRDRFRIDLDGDGAVETPLGVCTDAATAISRAYEPCGLGVFRCEIGTQCLLLTDVLGVCSLPCEGDLTCPSLQDRRGQCESLRWDDANGDRQEANLCMLTCALDRPEDCPSGMACTETGFGPLCLTSE